MFRPDFCGIFGHNLLKNKLPQTEYADLNRLPKTTSVKESIYFDLYY